jgi:hypothetical protein
MTGHLKRHHKIIVDKTKNKTDATTSEQLKQYYHQAEVNGDITEFDSEVLKKYLFQAVITKALVTLIIIWNLSFYIVKWPEFHTFCQALNKECKKGTITTAHSQIKERIKEA